MNVDHTIPSLERKGVVAGKAVRFSTQPLPYGRGSDRLRTLLCVTAALNLCAVAIAEDPAWIARGTGGMVASDSEYASQIGARILEQGGNAFDAAVATSFALGLTRPYSTGLGGGGFMVAYVAKDKRFVVLDFRETAPAGATAERYAALRAKQGEGPSASIYGGNAAGTPGLLAGLSAIAERYGTKPLSELIQPAKELAERGFAVDRNYHNACAAALRNFDKRPEFKTSYEPLYVRILGSGKAPAVGDIVRRADLARAFGLIAESGPSALYRGPIGERMAAAASAADGTMTTDDLKGYRVREREPIRIKYRDKFEIVSMPPPSSGGICIAETLNILEPFLSLSRIPTYTAGDEHDWSHNLIEAMKHAFADRARWLGDADFSDVPVERLIDKSYAGELHRKLRPDAVSAPDTYGMLQLPDDRGTSHFCVADGDGNIVALTETINGGFGSYILVEPFGIILNNQMDDFVTVRGEENLYGLIQSDANLVEPGKRPLSSMSPTIVLEDGRPVLVLGASGGPRIISHVLQVMLNVIDREMPLGEAISAMRLHHQWKPDTIFFDGEPPADLVKALEARGHKISPQRRGAVVQAIQFLDDGTMIGASDPRKGGRPAAARIHK